MCTLPCSSLFNLEQSTLIYWMSSMSWTSTVSSVHTVNSCNLWHWKTSVYKDCYYSNAIIRIFFVWAVNHKLKEALNWISAVSLVSKSYLVEIRLKTALKLLQLREKRTAEAELRSWAACCWPSRYECRKWQISGSNCFTSMASSNLRQSFGC